MSEVVITMSLGANGILAGALVNSQGVILESISCPSSYRESLTQRCSSFVHEALQRCGRLHYQPVAIGVATNGEVREGIIWANRFDREGIPLRRSLETQFQLPTRVMNRFHACALGVSQVLKDDSLGVLNVSNAVGYGVVSSGKVQEHYDPEKGAGGLRRIRRLSDGRLLSIAHIAGGNAMTERVANHGTTRASLTELFQWALSGDREAGKIVDDAQDAIAELASDLHTSFRPQKIAALVYSSEPLAHRERTAFLNRVQERLDQKISAAPQIQLLSDLSEEDAKLIGVARAALEGVALHQRAFAENSSSCSSGSSRSTSQSSGNLETGHIFAVTGTPASGKTTFVAQTLLEKLRERGVRVGGVISQEKRNQRERTGFNMTLLSPDSGWSEPIELAVTEKYASPDINRSNYMRFVAPVSTFLVNVQNVTDYVVPALKRLQQTAEVIVIDEVATMQLFSRDFERAVNDILQSNIPTIVTIPMRSRSELVHRIRTVAERNGLLCMLRAEDRTGSQRRGEEQLLPRIMSEVERFRESQEDQRPRKRRKLGE